MKEQNNEERAWNLWNAGKIFFSMCWAKFQRKIDRIHINLVCLVMLFGVAGCGAQGGKYVTTGSQSNALAPNVGCVEIVIGYERTDMLHEQNLLYLLIVTPGVQTHGSSGRSDYGKFITTLNHFWETEKGAFSTAVSWNRQTDIVAVGRQKFFRESGNVFFVRFNEAGEVVGQQLPSLGLHANCAQVLDHVRQCLPNDKLVSSLKLLK